MRLWWRGRKAPDYRKRLIERLGKVPHKNLPPSLIWVHAVSVGEVMAASILIEKWHQSDPSQAFYITTTTPTGSQRVRELWSEKVYHSYLPYDLGFLLKAFMKRVQPQALVIIETELWPNLLRVCRQLQVPSVLVNARLSEKSAKGYQKAGVLTRNMLQDLTQVLVQNQKDGQRFIDLGLTSSKLLVTGSIKYDRDLPSEQIAMGRTLKTQWLKDELVIVAASTHEGEDKQLLEVFQQLKKSLALRLIIVPRHPERFNSVYQLVESQALAVIKKSQGAIEKDWQVMVGDTMGEMFFYFSLAELCFMGGTLVPTGGHNMLEPAALGLPVVTGPHLHNFAEISASMQEAGALFVGKDVAEVQRLMSNLLENQHDYALASESAKREVSKNQGAVDRTLVALREDILKSCKD